MENILDKARWLSGKQKSRISNAIERNPVASRLDSKRKNKLLIILCCIPYAEEKQDRHGKFRTRLIEELIRFSGLETKLDTSLGSWQLNVKHHWKFGLSKKDFKAVISNDEEGINYVIELLVYHIGLDKDATHIFAEYNLKEDATVIAALQKTLNQLRISLNGHWPQLDEDGILGNDTVLALGTCLQTLEIDKEFSEKKPAQLLAALQEKSKIKVKPFVPDVKEKRDWKYLIKVLKQSIKNIGKLKKALNFFKNDVDVRGYARFAMEAYKQLI